MTRRDKPQELAFISTSGRLVALVRAARTRFNDDVAAQVHRSIRRHHPPNLNRLDWNAAFQFVDQVF